MSQNQVKLNSVDEANQFLSKNQSKVGIPGFLATVKYEPLKIKNTNIYTITYIDEDTKEEQKSRGGTSYLSDDGVIFSIGSGKFFELRRKYLQENQNTEEANHNVIYECYKDTPKE